MSSILQRLEQLEKRQSQLLAEDKVRKENEAQVPISKNYYLRKAQKIQNLFGKPWAPNALNGVFRGIVIDTRDPWMKGRIKIFIPQVHANIYNMDNLPWAERAEFFGSLEDQGSAFVPPAGSTVVVCFESGNRDIPICLGCLWSITRRVGKKVENTLLIEEENELWGVEAIKREDQKNPETNPDPKYLMPLWNNESYNGPDKRPGGGTDFGKSPSFPHIYGIKTPEKHFLQFVDGDFDADRQGKRIVLQSSKGNVLYMKDDAFSRPVMLYNHPYWDDFRDGYPGLTYSNAAPYNNHKIELEQTGVQLQSFAGHRIIMSDINEEVSSDNQWETPWTPIKKMESFLLLESITEHRFWLRDSEKAKELRGPEDGIFGVTATGHLFAMKDDCEGNKGGPERAIILHSTSGHKLEMNDFTVQNATARKGPYESEEDSKLGFSYGSHKPSAIRAFFKLQSGWGQFINLNDFGSQVTNAQQFIMIANYNTLEPNCINDPFTEDDDCEKNKKSGGGGGGSLPPYNYIRMECVVGDRLFTLFGAGFMLIDVCNTILRRVHNNHDLTLLDRGMHFVRARRSIIFHRAELSSYYWTTFGVIQLMVGRIIGCKLEFPIRQVVISKPPDDPWVCPVTGRVHNDTPSEHVFASE